MESKLVKTFLAASGTTLVVKSPVVGTADDFSLLSTYPFTLVLDPDTVDEEIVTVTGRTGGSLTVVRGQNGTTPRDHQVNAVVKHMVTARDLQEPQDHIYSTTDVHGISDTTKVVLTTDTATVATAMIANGGVTTAKIADGNVTTAKIADSNVTTAKVADSAITSAKIADGTIVDADINASAAIAQSKVSNLVSDLAAKTTDLTAHTSASTSVHGITDTADLVTKTMLNSALPIGSITMWALATVPSGWLECNGTTYNATTYAGLYSVLGTTTLPNLSGKVPVGLSSDVEFDTMLETGGVKSVTLTSAQSGVPAHTHANVLTNGNHRHNVESFLTDSGTGVNSLQRGAVAASDSTANSAGDTSNVNITLTNVANTAADASAAHTNLQPYTVVKFIIKAA